MNNEIQAVKIDIDEMTERAREAVNSDLDGYMGRQWVSPEEVFALTQRISELEQRLSGILCPSCDRWLCFCECQP